MRRAAWRERRRLAEDRWARFQAASHRRYHGRAGRTPPAGLAKLLARGKAQGRALLLAASGVWDRDVGTGLGSRPGGAAALMAYVRAGPDAEVQPKALFDQAWYLGNAPGLAGSRWAPLAHYLVLGDLEGRSPHPLVDVRAVRREGGRLTALQDFLFRGAAEGVNPHPLFDLRHYVGQSEAVARSGENPLAHYLRQGWREGLNPHPLFANAWYLDHAPGAAEAGVAPLLHYVTQGAAGGADPHPAFETALWDDGPRRPTGADDPLSDYLRARSRSKTERSPSTLFNTSWYLAQVGEDQEARADPLLHYLTVGTFLGHSPAPDFDEAAWFRDNPGAAAEARSGLELAARRRSDVRSARRDDWAAYLQQLGEAAPEPPAARPPVFVLWRGPPRDLAGADRFLARYGLAGFCHEVADPASAAKLWAAGAAETPFLVAWTGERGPDEALPALAPGLASPLGWRIDGRPALVVPDGARASDWQAAAEAVGVGGLAVLRWADLQRLEADPLKGPGVLQAQAEQAVAAGATVLVDGWHRVAPGGPHGIGWLEAIANGLDAELLER
jgi:hypothetical protein